MTALVIFVSALCTERETARPAMLKMASREDVSIPSVPAMSMMAMKTRTSLTSVRMKLCMVVWIFDFSSRRPVSRISSLMNTTQTMSRIAAAMILESAFAPRYFSQKECAVSAVLPSAASTPEVTA